MQYLRVIHEYVNIIEKNKMKIRQTTRIIYHNVFFVVFQEIIISFCHVGSAVTE